MTNEQQQVACAQLARRMGWTDIQWLSGCQQGRLQSSRLEPIPDPFTDPVASRELVVWLKANFLNNSKIRYGFCEALIEAIGIEESWHKSQLDELDILEILLAPPEVIARAACKALGIEVEE